MNDMFDNLKELKAQMAKDEPKKGAAPKRTVKSFAKSEKSETIEKPTLPRVAKSAKVTTDGAESMSDKEARLKAEFAEFVDGGAS
jgi:hypothetical protein